MLHQKKKKKMKLYALLAKFSLTIDIKYILDIE